MSWAVREIRLENRAEFSVKVEKEIEKKNCSDPRHSKIALFAVPTFV